MANIETTWSGSSLNDLYENNDPYCFTNNPVAPSKFHAVLYELPATLTAPPKPHRNIENHHLDRNYVKLSYYSQMFTIKNDDGEKILKNRWEVIENSLLQPINSSRELEAVIKRYNARLPPFAALHYFFEEVLDEEAGEVFFKTLLPGIIQLALQLPEILPGNLPLLQKQTNAAISLSQLQIASLLANAFLCTFPGCKDVPNTYPGINFARLFAAHHRPKRINCVIEKIKAICHYFRRVLSKAPVGTVTFERKFLQRNQFPRWDRLGNNLRSTKMHICSSGTIEDNGHGLLQVDFANRFIGGGVLEYGCVQEEIRFIICPELIISRLFTEELGASEALVITGVERYSNYSGYGDTFTWEGDYLDETPHDCYGRRKTSVVAIDAIKFRKPSEQFSTSQILRELNKAYVGFRSNSTGKLAPVATGNWGCGAYKGDPRLKSLIQLLACSAANRNMVYYTFGDVDLEKTLHNLYTFIVKNEVTISEMWRILCRFVSSNTHQNNFIPYIQQAYFDLHSQPSIANFFVEQSSNSSQTSSTQKKEITLKHTRPVKPFPNKKDILAASTSANDFKNTKKTIRDLIDDKSRYEKSARESSDAENEDDVIDLIKLINGDIDDDKGKDDFGEQSLLSSIDNYCKNQNKVETNEASDSVCITMEVDETTSEKATSSPKRKISDYFVKISK